MSSRKPQSSARRSPIPQAEAVPWDETPSTGRMDRNAFGLRQPSPAAQPASAGLTSHEPDLLEASRAGEGWLQIRWSVSARTLERARASLGRGLKPHRWLLRIHRVERDDSGPRCRSHFADVEVGESDREWFAKVRGGDDAWVVELGLVRDDDRFFTMMHTVPVIFGSSISRKDEAELAARSLPNGALEGTLPLSLSASVVLRGITHPQCRLTIDDQSTAIDPGSGEFLWSAPLSGGRTVFPVEAAADGQLRRALVAVETNIRLLDPQTRDER